MSGDPKDDAAKVDAIEAFLADQIINASDEEALAAVSADDIKVALAAVERAKSIVGKRRLAAAKAGFAASTASSTVVPFDASRTRKRLESLVRGDGEKGTRLTFAARGAKGDVDADDEGILEDLNELLGDDEDLEK